MLIGVEKLCAHDEIVQHAADVRVVEVPDLCPDVVGVVVDHREAERVVHVLDVELGQKLQGLVGPKRRPHAEGDAVIIVEPALVEEHAGRVGLPRIVLVFLEGERPREVLFVTNVIEVEPVRRAAVRFVSEAAVCPPPRLLRVFPVRVEQLRIAEPCIKVEGPVDLPCAEVVFEVAERADLASRLEYPGVVARLRDEVDRAAKGVAAEPQRVCALEHFYVLERQRLYRFEVAEPVGVSVDESVHEKGYAS